MGLPDSDADLLAYAIAEGRTLVTNNVVDSERLRRQRSAAGEPVPPLIYTSDATFPRDRRFIGRLVDGPRPRVSHRCRRRHRWVLWLRPAPE